MYEVIIIVTPVIYLHISDISILSIFLLGCSEIAAKKFEQGLIRQVYEADFALW